MLRITNPVPNRIEVQIDGPFGAEDMRAGLDAFIKIGERTKDGVILYTINDFAMPSFAAVGVKLGQLPKLFGMLGNFKRAAVLTDSSFLSKAAEIEGALIPGLDIKAFGLDESEAAERWLNEENASSEMQPEQ